MCHQSAYTLQDVVRGNHEFELPHSLKFAHKCSFCVAGEPPRALFLTSIKVGASKPLELVDANICGPITP